MNTEQTALFIELTRLQQHVSLAKLHGTNIREAYRTGGGKAKTDNAMDNLWNAAENVRIASTII